MSPVGWTTAGVLLGSSATAPGAVKLTRARMPMALTIHRVIPFTWVGSQGGAIWPLPILGHPFQERGGHLGRLGFKRGRAWMRVEADVRPP